MYHEWNDQPPTLTPAQFARPWGFTGEHVRQLIKRGEIEAYRVGNRYLIPVSEQARCAAIWAARARPSADRPA